MILVLIGITVLCLATPSLSMEGEEHPRTESFSAFVAEQTALGRTPGENAEVIQEAIRAGRLYDVMTAFGAHAYLKAREERSADRDTTTLLGYINTGMAVKSPQFMQKVSYEARMAITSALIAFTIMGLTFWVDNSPESVTAEAFKDYIQISQGLFAIGTINFLELLHPVFQRFIIRLILAPLFIAAGYGFQRIAEIPLADSGFNLSLGLDTGSYITAVTLIILILRDWAQSNQHSWRPPQLEPLRDALAATKEPTCLRSMNHQTRTILGILILTLVQVGINFGLSNIQNISHADIITYKVLVQSIFAHTCIAFFALAHPLFQRPISRLVMAGALCAVGYGFSLLNTYSLPTPTGEFVFETGLDNVSYIAALGLGILIFKRWADQANRHRSHQHTGIHGH